MTKLLIATHNPGKLHEIREFLSYLAVEIVSLSDVGVTQDVEEDGKTYEENSRKKALFYAKLTGLPAVADDGGLEISALGGAPGVKSRRWLGYTATDDELLAHLEKISKELPEDDRRARFVTVVTLALPSGEAWSSQGEVNGVIAKKPLKKKKEGLPFRSFFYLPELQKYYFETELTDIEKESYNHRLHAVRKLIPRIKEKLA